MVSYLVRRVIYMLLLLVLLSFVSFVLIELPPGDALSTINSGDAGQRALGIRR